MYGQKTKPLLSYGIEVALQRRELHNRNPEGCRCEAGSRGCARSNCPVIGEYKVQHEYHSFMSQVEFQVHKHLEVCR